MIGYLMVGTNYLTRSLAFYDAVFAPLGFEHRLADLVAELARRGESARRPLRAL